jgi:hypothetical protein
MLRLTALCESKRGEKNMVYMVIVLAVLTRFIPHAPNFSPVYGALLFAGANLKKRDSLWFSAVTFGASDIVLTKFVYHLSVGWGEPIQMAAFVSVAMIGWVLQTLFHWASRIRVSSRTDGLLSHKRLRRVARIWQLSAHLERSGCVLRGGNSIPGPHHRQHGSFLRNSFSRTTNLCFSCRAAKAFAGTGEIGSARHEDLFLFAFRN